MALRPGGVDWLSSVFFRTNSLWHGCYLELGSSPPVTLGSCYFQNAFLIQSVRNNLWRLFLKTDTQGMYSSMCQEKAVADVVSTTSSWERGKRKGVTIVTTPSPSPGECQLAQSEVEFRSWLIVKQSVSLCLWQCRFTPRSCEATGTRNGCLEIKSYVGIIVVIWNHTVPTSHCRDF